MRRTGQVPAYPHWMAYELSSVLAPNPTLGYFWKIGNIADLVAPQSENPVWNNTPNTIRRAINTATILCGGLRPQRCSSP